MLVAVYQDSNSYQTTLPNKHTNLLWRGKSALKEQEITSFAHKC